MILTFMFQCNIVKNCILCDIICSINIYRLIIMHIAALNMN